MTAIIPSQRVANCVICWEEANPNDSDPKIRPVTHIEGENHDGFHPECLSKWINETRISKCPTCNQGIDPSTFLSRTKRIMNTLEPVFDRAVSVLALFVMSKTLYDCAKITYLTFLIPLAHDLGWVKLSAAVGTAVLSLFIKRRAPV